MQWLRLAAVPAAGRLVQPSKICISNPSDQAVSVSSYDWKILGYGEFDLAIAYSSGRGVAQDHAEAAKWCSKAAEQNLPQAQHCLGVSYNKGLGVPQNDALAVEWFRKAAENGVPASQLNLGLNYATGRGVARNEVEAYKWIELCQLATMSAPPSSTEGALNTAALGEELTLGAHIGSANVKRAEREAATWRAAHTGSATGTVSSSGQIEGSSHN